MRQTLDSHSRRRPGPFSHGAVDPGLRRTWGESIKVARPGSQGWVVFLLVIALGLLVMLGVIFVELSQRRIPVQYAKRMVGRRMFGGTTTYIPIKVNQAGVIPVVFASSLLYLPAPYAKFRQATNSRPGSAPTSSRATIPSTSSPSSC